MNDATLKELWQQVAEQDSAEAKYKELCAQRETVAAQVKKLERPAGTNRPTWTVWKGAVWRRSFYQVIGKMDEKLDKEREEAYAARVKADAAARELASIDADLQRCRARLDQLEGCGRRYQEALAGKVQELKAGGGPAAQELMECETRIEGMRLRKKELKEALDAGKNGPPYHRRGDGLPGQRRGLEYMGRDGRRPGGRSGQV